MRKAVFLFGGQGSQYFNMGEELYHSNATFRNTLLWLDAEASRMLGTSVITQMYNKNKKMGDVFDELRYTNPALFMVQYAMAKVLQEELRIYPSYVLGYSLGEMVAAAVAGVVHPLNMLEALIRQAVHIDQVCGKGGMMAVLDDPGLYGQEPEVFRNITLAAVNYHEHFIVAADDPALKRLKAYLDIRGKVYSQLPVQYAFHTQMMDPARDAFMDSFRNVGFSNPTIPFLSGVYAKQLYATSPAYYWEVVREPIRFNEAVKELERKGEYFYIDCSSSGTLKNMLAKILSPASGSVHHHIMSPFRDELRRLQLLKQQYSLTTF